jgi:hypothetical protein
LEAYLSYKLKSISFLNLCGGTLDIAATTGLLYQPRVIGDGDCGEIGGLKLAGETEVLGENLRQRHFCPSQTPT